MPSKSSGRVVLIAILVNLIIAACKYAVAAVTRSAAMLAEAFHSTADTGNELLLLLGMKRSLRPPDSLHPFGRGKTLYFYSLLVAVYVFGFEGGLACYQGIARLRHPEPTTMSVGRMLSRLRPAALDFYSWRVSYKALLAQKSPDETSWDEIVGSKDPTVFTVFLEDSAGLVGAALAFLGIFFGHLLHNPYLDLIASILIGILLGGVALLLGRESGALLVGERTNRSKIRRVQEIVQNDDAVDSVGDLLTMQLGPDQALLNVDIRFRRDMDVRQLEKAIDRIEAEIRRREPTIQRLFVEADALRQKNKSSEAA